MVDQATFAVKRYLRGMTARPFISLVILGIVVFLVVQMSIHASKGEFVFAGAREAYTSEGVPGLFKSTEFLALAALPVVFLASGMVVGGFSFGGPAAGGGGGNEGVGFVVPRVRGVSRIPDDIMGRYELDDGLGEQSFVETVRSTLNNMRGTETEEVIEELRESVALHLRPGQEDGFLALTDDRVLREISVILDYFGEIALSRRVRGLRTIR